MTQYWIQTPIENAKEVVRRFLIENGLYTNPTIAYDNNCEVVYYNLNPLWPGPFANYIFFGTIFILDHQHEVNLKLAIDNLNGVDIYTLDASQASMVAGKYENLIFTNFYTLPSDPNAYFVGYKFRIS